MKKEQQKPKHVQLSAKQFEELQLKIQNNELNSTDKSLVTSSLSSFLWLKSQLEQSKITIAQLRSLFGITTEKKSLEEMEMMLQEMKKMQKNQT